MVACLQSRRAPSLINEGHDAKRSGRALSPAQPDLATQETLSADDTKHLPPKIQGHERVGDHGDADTLFGETYERE